MLWFFIAGFFGILFGVGLIGGFAVAETPEGKFGMLGLSGVSVVLLLVVTAFMSFAQVDTGHLGIVRTFGRITGQITPGVSMKMPWQSVTSVNVQVQKHQFVKLTAFSSETQSVYVTATINYSVLPGDAEGLIRRVGTDWFDRLVPNNMNQAFKDETVKYAAVDIAPNRETIRIDVLNALRSRLGGYSIRVNDLNIDDISFSTQFEQAIEAKQEATQAALRAQAQVKQAEFEAQSQVARAKGEADANVTRAAGQAEANRKLAASLSPEVLQYIAIQKLADNVTIALIPSGGGSLIDPTKLLQGAGK